VNESISKEILKTNFYSLKGKLKNDCGNKINNKALLFTIKQYNEFRDIIKNLDRKIDLTRVK